MNTTTEEIARLTFAPAAGAIDIDLDLLIRSRMLIQANSGGGKSRALRYVLEQTYGKIPQIVLDPEGEFSSLREQFPYVLVGDEGDLPIAVASARVLCRKLVELNASAVINLYDLKPQERKKFVRLFLEELIGLPRELWHPMLLALDEAHQFCPERGTGEAESTEAVISFCALGRKRGYAPLLATQRLSKLHKDAAAELLNVLIGRTGLDIDVRRAGDTLGFDKEKRQALKYLEPGVFFAFGPAISREVVKVRTGAVQTTHPEPGRIVPTPPPPPERLRSLIEALKSLPLETADSAADDQVDEELAAARARIQVLEHQLQVQSRQIQQLQKSRSVVCSMQAIARQVLELTTDLEAEVRDQKGQASRIIDLAEESSLTSKTISKPQQAILNALAAFEALGLESVNRSNLAVYADSKPKSSGYTNNLGALRSLGLIDYPASGKVALTPQGREMTTASQPMTIATLHEAWYRKLPNPQTLILKELIKIHPDSLSRQALADQIGQSPISSGYNNNLGALRSLGLIDYPRPGWIVATQLLFPQKK